MSSETLALLIDFVKKYLPYKDEEMIKEFFEKHLEYNTCDWATDKNGEIIFVVRYNIEGSTVDCLDLIINPLYRRQQIIKWIILRNWDKFPKVKYITYKRGLKDKRIRQYELKQLFKLKGVNHGKRRRKHTRTT